MPYIDIQDGSTTLSDSNPSHQFSLFEVPNVDLGERPVLTFRVNPNPDPTVTLQMTLNGDLIVNQVFDSSQHRAWQEIVEATALVAPPADNILIAERIGGTGEVSVSDVVLTYKT
jgi:hypothetical protein